jgi:uncharacterized protein YecT (DUF1311 family)
VGKLVGVLMLSITMLPMAAHAQSKAQVESRYSKDYKQCMATGDAASGVTAGIMDCNGSEIDRQDARLNQSYKMVMMRLGASEKTALRASERSWIGLRDAHCKQESSAEEGGSLAAVIYSQCILEGTVKRTIWLEGYGH